MVYTSMVNHAMVIAYEAHKGQIDLGDIPYIFHPAHLAEQFHSESEVAVALLHDVVEDTEWTLEGLEDTGFFSQEVLDAVEAITRHDGEPYMEYIARVKHNKIAAAVKKADLLHNMMQERCWYSLPSSLVERYKAALAVLEA